MHIVEVVLISLAEWYATLGPHLFHFNPFNPEFTIVIVIHYKPRIAVAILDL